MIRNIIKQRDSYTITLPKNWIQKNTLKNKDPLAIEEDEFSGELKVSPINKNKEPKEIILDMKSFDDWDATVSINQAHRLGYDNIVCINLLDEHKPAIEKFVNHKLIGFTYETKKDKIIIENMVQDLYDEEKIESNLRKLFTIVKQTLTSNKEELENYKHNADKTSYYLRRNIIKFEYKGKLAHQYVSLVNRLILIQHSAYRYNKKSKQKFPKEIIELYETLENGFWTKSIQTIASINDIYKIAEQKIDNILKNKPAPETKYLYEAARMTKLCVPVAAGILMKTRWERH